MSKRNSKPKILQTLKYDLILTGARAVRVKCFVLCFPDEMGKRTNHYVVQACYKIAGQKMKYGIAARYLKKSAAISRILKTQQDDIQSCINESLSDLRRTVLGSLKGVEGIVRWFDRLSGDGVVEVEGVPLRVYGCNIKGAKTGFPETACMYLEPSSKVIGDLFDFHDHVSLVNIQGGVFDAEAWAKLDHSKLAFKRDENGNFINGLF